MVWTWLINYRLCDYKPCDTRFCDITHTSHAPCLAGTSVAKRASPRKTPQSLICGKQTKPGEFPEEFERLPRIEDMSLAPIKIIMCAYTLKGEGQRRHRRHVLSAALDVAMGQILRNTETRCEYITQYIFHGLTAQIWPGRSFYSLHFVGQSLCTTRRGRYWKSGAKFGGQKGVYRSDAYLFQSGEACCRSEYHICISISWAA